MAFLQMQRVLLIKEESVYGTDSVPVVASNAIDASNIKYSKNGELIERDLARGSRGQIAPILGKRMSEISFECELKGSGTRGLAPRLGDLFEACGFSESIGSTAGSSSVVYRPSNSTHKSLTVYLYEIPETGNAKLIKLTGARGNVKATLDAGQIAKLEFTLKGKWVDNADVTSPGAATYESTKPPLVESSSFTFNGVTTLVAQSINVDMANELTTDEDINSANGIQGFSIVRRKPNGSFNPESVLVATLDIDSLIKNTTECAMSLVVGSVSGNKCTISAPKVSIDSLTNGDRNGKIINELPFRCNINTGADDIELKFE